MSSTCIDIVVRRIGDALAFGTERLGDGVSFDTERLGGPMSLLVGRHGDALSFETKRNGEPLSFRCGIVCSVGSDFYLRVEPEAIWLLPDSAEVAVYSNVTWYVE